MGNKAKAKKGTLAASIEVLADGLVSSGLMNDSGDNDTVQGAAIVTETTQRYMLGAPKRKLLDKTSLLKSNEATFAAIAEVAMQQPDRQISWAQVQAVCKARDHSGFASYALRRRWLLPVSAE